jgi:hypothetical protein
MHLYELLQLQLMQPAGQQCVGVAAGPLHKHLLLKIQLEIEGRRQRYILLRLTQK